ncbi:MAG: UDP-N-acetylglucosamine 2-epimerase [Bacteroidales bacterium]
MRKICFVTGSRAEYGLLSNIMRFVKENKQCELQIIATNMHLSPEYGLTYREIEADGFVINRKVEMLLASDTPNATTKSVGLATIGFADAYEDLKPDLLVVLGDRYEILSAVSAALFYQIPVAHLHGGEITEGAYDDAIRHAITKMSHLHFTSTESYRQRVIQLGENPDHVFNVGAVGVDNILSLPLLSKADLEKSINFELTDKSLLVTYHPVTLGRTSAETQIVDLLEALKPVLEEYKVIFTMPNSDTNGRIIKQRIQEFVQQYPHETIAFDSLGLKRYLSALKYVTAVVGNSSSGIIEVPSFGIPTLNIGDRQKGRLCADSVLHCDISPTAISKGLAEILSPSFLAKSEQTINPYHKANTAKVIAKMLCSLPLDGLIMKSFYDTKQ